MISIRSRFIWYLIIWPDPTHWPTEPPIHPHTYHAWGVSTNHKSSNRTELSRLGQDLFNCYSFDMIRPIDPSNHPPMGGGMSTNHKSSNRTELSRLGQDLFNCYSFDMIPPIDPPNHPPMGGGMSTNHKSYNRIELSRLGQDWLNF